MTDWSDWEYVETYCGCKIYRSDMYDDYVYGSPCITGYYWTKAAVKKRIEAGGYCNGAPPPEEEVKAFIVSVDLPDELQAGSWIVGKFTAKNIGTITGIVRVRVELAWLDKVYAGDLPLAPGQEGGFGFSEGVLRMPSQDASFTIKGQHQDPITGEWITDDTKTH